MFLAEGKIGIDADQGPGQVGELIHRLSNRWEGHLGEIKVEHRCDSDQKKDYKWKKIAVFVLAFCKARPHHRTCSNSDYQVDQVHEPRREQEESLVSTGKSTNARIEPGAGYHNSEHEKCSNYYFQRV